MKDKISLRDHFAGRALQGMIAYRGLGRYDAIHAYKIADAMLKERENHEHKWVDNYSAGMLYGKALRKSCTICGKVELLEE